MATFSPRFLELERLSEEERAALLRRADQDIEPMLERVRPIVEAVRREGDAALLRFAREFDGVQRPLGSLLAREAEIARAYDEVGPELVAAIRFAIANIRAFHERQKPEPLWLHEIRPGAFAGDRWTPVPSVALYVPRGKGAFPSVTMMTAVPAVVAGVPEITILTPPTPEGGIDAATLVAAAEAGVKRIVKAGGAQAVAAAAFGTESVPKAAKIVGPGSPWVVAAKRLVAHLIDTGPPAGPSESIVFADETADPELAAADLLIEAEHGPDSSAYLLTPSRAVAEGAQRALERRWAALPEPRRGFVKAVLEGPRGGILLAPSLEAAYAFVEAYAPEHLEVLSADPWAHLGHLRNAAEILMGPWTPITLGNFVLGPNCVLPTGGWAKSFGPLSVLDFMKRSSIGYVTAGAYPALARPAVLLAEYEGFPAHAAGGRGPAGGGGGATRRAASSRVRSSAPPYRYRQRARTRPRWGLRSWVVGERADGKAGGDRMERMGATISSRTPFAVARRAGAAGKGCARGRSNGVPRAGARGRPRPQEASELASLDRWACRRAWLRYRSTVRTGRGGDHGPAAPGTNRFGTERLRARLGAST